MGPVAPRHVGSSQTRARTRVPCISRQILNHCATREALHMIFNKGTMMNLLEACCTTLEFHSITCTTVMVQVFTIFLWTYSYFNTVSNSRVLIFTSMLSPEGCAWNANLIMMLCCLTSSMACCHRHPNSFGRTRPTSPPTNIQHEDSINVLILPCVHSVILNLSVF